MPKKGDLKDYENLFKSPGDDNPGERSLWEVTETTPPRVQSKPKGKKKND